MYVRTSFKKGVPEIFCYHFQMPAYREDANNKRALIADHKGAIYQKDSDALFCL